MRTAVGRRRTAVGELPSSRFQQFEHESLHHWQRPLVLQPSPRNLSPIHVVNVPLPLSSKSARSPCPPFLPTSGRIHEGIRDTSSLALRAHYKSTSSLALRAHLLKATRSQDLDEAFEKVLSEYLELKIAALQETTDRLEEKWGMEFSTFKQRLADDDLPDDAYSYDVEQDYWEWEEAETLKAHYQQVQAEWTQKRSSRICA